MIANNLRKLVIRYIFIFVGIIYLLRLFYIQIVDHSYRQLATNNVVATKIIIPPRGYIYDRTGKLIVTNESIYDIMVIPRQVPEEIDTVKFCRLTGIDKATLIQNIDKAKKYSRSKLSVIVRQLSVKDYARFQEYQYQFPGFYAQVRNVRTYPYQSAAHVLGDIGEVDKKRIENNSYYKMGDYIGITGIEKAYEEDLRGAKGKKYVIVDAHNLEKGSFKEGTLDTTVARQGDSLTATLNIMLQNYGEQLMQNKVGSIVAIEPETGEILAFVSSPSYDPNLMVGSSRGESFRTLLNDSLRPLFNRPIMGAYPPGSTFKVFQSLIALQEKAVSRYEGYPCSGGYYTRGLHVGCHEHAPVGNVEMAIAKSCNAYYCNTFRKILENRKYKSVEEGFENWRAYTESFGFGQKVTLELENEMPGFIPGPDYYNKLYGKGRWKAPTVLSLAIGQGEILVTPVQLANAYAAIANRGNYYTPHFVKTIAGRKNDRDEFNIRHTIPIDSSIFEIVVEGMYQVVENGTARIAKIKGIDVCGKTGTAENPHGKDHSVFAAFAPKKKPKIAISVYVENGGFGATWAAPIASLMIEKYLTDSIADNRKWLEQRILEGNLIGLK